MAEKEVKKVPARVENIIKGLFAILFAVVLTINMGKVARTFAFPLIYLFGTCYYFIVEFVLFCGLYRIVKQKKLKIGSAFGVIGLFFIFFGVLFIVGYASVKGANLSYNGQPLGDAVSKFHIQLGSYYNQAPINLFDTRSKWANGLVGISLGYLIQNDAAVLSLGIILIALAFLSFFLPSFLKKRKKESKPAKEVKEEKKEVVDNNPVIRQTRVEKEPAEVTPGFESDREPLVNENSGFSQNTISLDEAFGVRQNTNRANSDNQEFMPLSFENDPFSISSNLSSHMNERPLFKEEFEEPISNEIEETVEEVEEEVNLIESRPTVEEEKVEEERKVLDEALVTIQPQFAPIEEKHEEVKFSVEQKPVEEVKKKRERVVWIPPSSELLMTYETQEAQELNEKVANERVQAINSILSDYKLGAFVSGYKIGPSITRFNIEYESNVSSKSVEKYVQDIARRLGGVMARFAAVVPGASYSGFEVPNATITTVGFKDTFNKLPDINKHKLSVPFGMNISGDVIFADFDEFPHLLVAGTTGSGKSIYVHSIITTLIMRVSPDDLKIVLIDPKKVEMTKYRDMPHLLCPIITEAEKAKVCLSKLADEMNRRYEMFALNGEVSNIKDYNKFAKETGADPLPYIIVFIDEYADLVDSCKEISQPIVSIAQKARAAGIHMCIATQRPSTNIITGVIKGNIPTHVALKTGSYTDSIIIIGEGGAETLLGKGDMLVQSPLVSTFGVTRLQGCFIQNKEIAHVVNYLKEHYETHYEEEFLDLVDHSKEVATNVLADGEVEKESSVEEENKYQSIKQWVMTQEFVSMSKIQRECSVGFNRAGRFFSRLQKEGVVSTSQDGTSKGCKVLVHDDYYGDSMVTSEELLS